MRKKAQGNPPGRHQFLGPRSSLAPHLPGGAGWTKKKGAPSMEGAP